MCRRRVIAEIAALEARAHMLSMTVFMTVLRTVHVAFRISLRQ